MGKSTSQFYIRAIYIPCLVVSFLLTFLSILLPRWSDDGEGGYGFLFYWCGARMGQCTQLNPRSGPGWLVAVRAFIILSAIFLCFASIGAVLAVLRVLRWRRVTVICAIIGIVFGLVALLLFAALHLTSCHHCTPGSAWAIGFIAMLVAIVGVVSRLCVTREDEEEEEEAEYNDPRNGYDQHDVMTQQSYVIEPTQYDPRV